MSLYDDVPITDLSFVCANNSGPVNSSSLVAAGTSNPSNSNSSAHQSSISKTETPNDIGNHKTFVKKLYICITNIYCNLDIIYYS